MIDSKYLNRNRYIRDAWGVASDISGHDVPEIARHSWDYIFSTWISPALPHKFPGVYDQWEVLRQHEATKSFTGAWTARLHRTDSVELVFHFEDEEDAIIARLIAGGSL
jgi:hypothetical protein